MTILEQLQAQKEEHLQAAAAHQAAAEATDRAIAAVQALNDIPRATITETMARTKPIKKHPKQEARGADWKKGLALWKAGKNAEDIATALGVSSAAVYQHKKSEGWPER